MAKKRKERKTDEEKQKIVLDLVMMDDAMFEVMCEDPLVVEEILQTIFNNPKLRIKKDTLVAQKSIKNIRGRSIRMDAYVEDEEDVVFNIEIQKADNCNHVKRVRYNAAVITTNNSEPGDDFEDIQNVCMIYITEKDIFHKGLTLYHVQNTIQETGDVIDNGLKEIYVNAEVKDGSKVSDLMDTFHKKELDQKDKEKFPNTYKKFTSLKNDEKEATRMCEALVKYAKKEAIWSVIEAYDDLGLTEEEILQKIAERFELSDSEAKAYYDDVFEEE